MVKKRLNYFDVKVLLKGDVTIKILHLLCVNFKLRLPYRNDAKITKICNLWTFELVIQLIDHLFKIRQKAFLPNAPYM